MESFWDALERPIVGLSPMDGVTDAPFRYMVANYGRPSVIFTEFVSVDGLHYAQGEKREQMLRAFLYDEGERPVVAQVFGKTPELFAEVAELVEKMGFDGLDINMGCPARKVAENGSGAGLIRTPEIAQAIVRAAKQATKLPVSVKTRVGVESVDELEEWMEALVEVEPSAISLHGRTLRQLYAGKADWEAIGRAGEIVHRAGGIILGNGDVETLEEVENRCRECGVDGVLLGRGALGNPGVFSGMKPDREQRLAWMVEHAKRYEEVLGKEYFMPMRKHLAWYARGFPGASEMRRKLVLASGAGEVEAIVMRYSGVDE